MCFFGTKHSVIMDKNNDHNLEKPKDNDAISTTSIGIQHPLPRDEETPDPMVELTARPDPEADPAAYLRSIFAVRERSSLVFAKARKNELNHFEVDWSKFKETATYVVSIIKRDYAPNYGTIPPHGRWQHFEVGNIPRIKELLGSWPSTVDVHERVRRLIDLFLVSVLLDAGAGSKWSYKTPGSNEVYRRSEGLGVASFDMFTSGLFSSNPNQPCQVDSEGLQKLTTEALARGFQVSQQNPMTGLDGRTGLLTRLSLALKNATFFGETCRPGNMIDYLLKHPTTKTSSQVTISIPTLWSVVMDGLSPIWPPSRTTMNGVSLGDAWPLSTMPAYSTDPSSWESIVPFHKLTQWLTYSIMVPMQRLLKIQFTGVNLLTGLPEYRNGGLLIDTGLLSLKPSDAARGVAKWIENSGIQDQPKVERIPTFAPDDDVVVEWRALTVGFLDELLAEINSQLGLEGKTKLNLAQMLEAGTWKAGREIAAVSRPNTKDPPIIILSDGTLF